MNSKDIIKLFFIFVTSCLFIFGLKGLIYAIIGTSLVFGGFVLFCLSWGIIIFLSDKFCD